MLTRAKNGIIKKKTFEDYCAYSCIVHLNEIDEFAFFSGFSAVLDIHEPVEPKSYKFVRGISEWELAMSEEIDALKKQGTWDLVPFPSGKNIVGSK